MEEEEYVEKIVIELQPRLDLFYLRKIQYFILF
jgi:hypothetical protein